MTVPRVSVVMSCYNASSTLERAIDSILRQTFTDFEMIIIDDGSSDGTLQLLRRIKGQDERIKLIINNHNLGLGASLNKGILATKGRYIARMDADDIAVISRLNEQVTFLDEHEQVDIVGSGIIQIAEKDAIELGIVLLPETHEAIIDRVFKKPLVFHPTVMLRREVYLDLGMYDPALRWAEDADLWYRIYDKVTFHNLQVPLLYYTVKEQFRFKHAKYNLQVKVDNLKRRGMVMRYIPQLAYDMVNFLRKVIWC